MRLGGYVRVSRVGGREGESFISPIEQRERLEAWCTAHGHTLATVAEDLDVSGGEAQRPQLLALLADIEAGRLDGLIVAKLDRFARNISHAVAMLDRIHQAGGQFVSVSEGFDSTTPAGRLALNMLLAFAQFELERIRDQWSSVVERMIGRGVHPGAVPPVGYERGPQGQLVPSDQAHLVTEAFQRRAGGETLSDVTRWLMAQNLRTAHGDDVSRSTVFGLLRNRAYLGEARSGELVNRDAHPALTDEVTFARAQQASPGRPPRTGEPAVLAGLVRCQGCRYAMAPVMREGKRRYRCLGRQNQRDCPAPAFVTEHELLPVVEEVLWSVYPDHVAQASGDVEAIEAATSVRDEARRVAEEWRDDASIQADLGMDTYLAGLRSRMGTWQDAERRLEQLLASRPDGLPDAASLRSSWPNMTSVERRAILGHVFDCLVIRKHPSRSSRLAILDRVLFIPAGTLTVEDLPSRHRRREQPLVPFDWPGDPTGPGVAGL
jgi:DNA invertase Pin-like site-specific DNA recombinase